MRAGTKQPLDLRCTTFSECFYSSSLFLRLFATEGDRRMRPDSAWRDVMAMSEQLIIQVKDLRAGRDQFVADYAPPASASRQRRLAGGQPVLPKAPAVQPGVSPQCRCRARSRCHVPVLRKKSDSIPSRLAKVVRFYEVLTEARAEPPDVVDEALEANPFQREVSWSATR